MTKIRVCKKCGSESIFFDAYVNVNDPEDVRTFDAVFCDQCGQTTEAVAITTESLTIQEIDPERLDAQRRLLARIIWGDTDSPLWGLVNMLDEWSDKRFPDRIYICTDCGSVECDGDNGRLIIPVSDKEYPDASEAKPCKTAGSKKDRGPRKKAK